LETVWKEAVVAYFRYHHSIYLKGAGKGKGKVFPVIFFEHNAMKAYWRSGSIAPRIL
jgi:hypothetical protein